jgi:8-oxo-dGTP pyrophosphatase MutT (NUDIX family)
MSVAAVLKKNLFWIVSRTALWGYHRMPIFGALRASLGLIRNNGRVLIVRRNDGRGLCFPGGLSWPWESDEKTLIREIEEETGLSCQSFEFAFRYESATDIVARIAVFNVQATGQLRGSWEGTPEWVKMEDVQPNLLPSQKYIVDRLLGRSQ